MGYGDEISELVGKTMASVERSAGSGDDEIVFTTTDGQRYRLFHWQDCCESVGIEDVVGDLDDLIGSPILMAEEASNSSDEPKEEWHDSYTWTFYKLATVKGYVTIRWYGTSNGYYSESVSFEKCEADS